MLQYFVYTGFGISQDSYGSESELYMGIRQGNLFSGKVYKTKSSRIIKNIEIKDIGILLKIPIIQEIIQRVAITFMDDTSFYSGGEDFQNNINEIMSEYEKLYEVIGGLVEYQKSYCYAW